MANLTYFDRKGKMQKADVVQLFDGFSPKFQVYQRVNSPNHCLIVVDINGDCRGATKAELRPNGFMFTGRHPFGTMQVSPKQKFKNVWHAFRWMRKGCTERETLGWIGAYSLESRKMIEKIIY
jgi:hypothetical protein